MSGRMESFDNTSWEDDYVDFPTAHSIHVYNWTWTNTACGMAGIYPIKLAVIAFQTKLTADEARQALAELDTIDRVRYDGRWLWSMPRMAGIKSRSPRMAGSIANDLVRVPADNPLLAELLEHYADDTWFTDEVLPAYFERRSGEGPAKVSRGSKPSDVKRSKQTVSRPSPNPFKDKDLDKENSSTAIQAVDARARLDDIQAELQSIWPTERCRSRYAGHVSAAFYRMIGDDLELAELALEKARAQIKANGWDDDFEHCPNLHRWLDERRWTDRVAGATARDEDPDRAAIAALMPTTAAA